MMTNFKQDFLLANTTYLLNHSVGRPLATSEQAFKHTFLKPWQESGVEPWASWLEIISTFQHSLAAIFNANPDDFCPQVNLSSSLTKIVTSLPKLESQHTVVLMSEIDFPSMGFALQKSMPSNTEIRFIDKGLDITDANVWQQHLTADVDVVFLSNAYSNTGQLAPVSEVIALANTLNIISILDVAQSAGIIPLNLAQIRPSFMIGSSVKWLCGGPGAAYLWLNPNLKHCCEPKDVGWFSHENPFEFDIHHFKYQQKALKFWGGTPSIAPFALAAHSINYFATLGSDTLRAHNHELIDLIIAEFSEFVRSPTDKATRSGTVILDFKGDQQTVMQSLAKAHISVDARHLGIRVSPHIYNDLDDINHFVRVIKKAL